MTQETLPDPDGAGPLTSSILHWAYDADGNQISQTDGLGHVTTDTYDDRNRKTSETDPLTGVTHWAFDAAGNLTKLTDPDGNATTYVYDNLNRVIQDTNQLGYSRYYSYDLDNNLTQETDRDGRVRDFSFDGNHRRIALHSKWLLFIPPVWRHLTARWKKWRQLGRHRQLSPRQGWLGRTLPHILRKYGIRDPLTF